MCETAALLVATSSSIKFHHHSTIQLKINVIIDILVFKKSNLRSVLTINEGNYFFFLILRSCYVHR